MGAGRSQARKKKRLRAPMHLHTVWIQYHVGGRAASCPPRATGRGQMKRRDFLWLSSAALASVPFASRMPSALAQGKPDSLAFMTWGGLWGNGLAQYVCAP